MALTGAVKEWKSLLDRNIVLPVAFDRQNNEALKSTPFNLTIKCIDGLIAKPGNGPPEYRMKASLFDMSYKQFFGRTWTSGPLPGKNNGQRVRITCNQNVYFHTSVTDEAVALVLELVCIHYGVDGHPDAQGLGWGMFRPFRYEGKGEMLDTSGSAANSPTLKMKMYHGSPRALVYLDEPMETHLSVAAGCTLDYGIRTHQYLQRAIHLLPENTLVGPNDNIPGLQIGQRDPKNAHIGPDALKKPKLLKAMPCYVEKISVTLTPSIDKFEEEMCRQLNEDRLRRETKPADGTTLQILKRSLYVGVHNGWTYVSEPELVHLSAGDGGGVSLKRSGSLRKSHQRTSSGGSIHMAASALTHKNRVELDGMLEDHRFVVAFNLVYEVGEQLPARDRRMSIAHPSYTVSARWAAFAPLASLNSQEQSLQLIGGPGPNPDGVFMFHSQSGETIGSNSSLSTMTGGSVTFSFQHQKQGKENMSHGETLQVPGYMPLTSGRAPSLTSVQTEGDSVLQEMQGQVMGRPPLPYTSARDLHSSASYYGAPPMGGITQDPASQPGGVPPLGLGASPPQTAYMQQSGGYGGMPYSPYGHPATTPRGYSIPVQIQHTQDTMTPPVSARMGMTTPDLHELPFTPVHAPIMATVPGMHSGSGLTRAAYAKLYSAGFPPVLDRKGEAADVVDPNDEINFIAAKEDADRLKTNEIHISFLAFSRLAGFAATTSGKQPSTVFFTFQFYRFPQVTSERLLLGKMEGEMSADPASSPCILRRIDKDGSVLQGPPGYQVKYYVDPAYLKMGEGRLFSQHLAQQTLHLDVWDGDSLHLIGSCAIELKNLCRQGREAVQCTYELDVVTHEYIEHDTPLPVGDVTRDGSVKPMDVNTLVRGRLHMRLANVGHPAAHKGAKTDIIPQSLKPKTLVRGESGSSFLGGSLNSLNSSNVKTLLNTKVAKAAPLAETDHELAQVLFSRKPQTQEPCETGAPAPERRKKLARMEIVRQKEGADTNSIVSIRKEKENRARDLKTIELYRHHGKKDGIMNMLNQAISTEHTINPSMGTTEFFEFCLKNPYNVQHTVTVICEDPELFVLTDPREWRHYKMLHEVYTPIEEGMFNNDTKTGHPEIYLHAKEMVNVPFKFLMVKADHTVHPQQPTDPNKPQAKKGVTFNKKAEDPLQTRIVKVFFNTDEGKPISILSVRVEPQPHVIDQTFRFHHPEQSFLRKTFRVPQLHTLPGVPVGGGGLAQMYVRCSDPNIICESRKVQQGEPHDISIKVAVGASPQIKKFFIALYTDAYLSSPFQIWQFYVHAMQRVDVSCIEGQTSRFTLILRGTQASRLVQCYPSHPGELQLHPQEPFMLAANTLQEINVGVRPTHTGSKFVYINVVDIEYHQLLRSWLVNVSCAAPVVSKAFELVLPVGGGKGCNKRIPYTNPYPNPRVLCLRTNREDLVQFKEQRLELAGGETGTIGIRFVPTLSPGSAEILVFINDQDDKNEETFCVKAIFQ